MKNADLLCLRFGKKPFLLLRKACQGLLRLTGSGYRIVDPLRALIDHSRDDREAEFRKNEEHDGEDDGHPEKETTVRQHQVHGCGKATLRLP